MINFSKNNAPIILNKIKELLNQLNGIKAKDPKFKELKKELENHIALLSSTNNHALKIYRQRLLP